MGSARTHRDTDHLYHYPSPRHADADADDVHNDDADGNDNAYDDAYDHADNYSDASDHADAYAADDGTRAFHYPAIWDRSGLSRLGSSTPAERQE